MAPGCGEPTPPEGDAGEVGEDAGGDREDAGGDRDDAGTPEVDAAAPDAGPPDAGPPEPCDSPGAVESVSCGMCGTTTRFCTASMTWAYGACEDEGVCAPGATGSGTCGNCGTQPQRCSDACTWESDGACTDEGECAPGTMTRSATGCPAGQQRDVECSDACVYEPTSACTADGCDTPGRIESVPCGSMCGTQERFCNVSRVWEYGACMGEGVCVPGTTGTTACGMCGMQATRCNDSCAWVTSGACTGEGTCTPGQTRRTSAGCPAGQTRLMECGSTCGFTVELEPCRTSIPIDVLFLVDASPSNWFDFQTQRTTFVPRCVDALLALTDVQVGIAYYGDLNAPVEPFQAGVEIGAGTSSAISTSVMTQSDLGGADDSTMEALHIVTGGTPATGSVPFVCSAGRVAGGCWRAGAERVIVVHTDEAARGGPVPTGPGLWNPWPTGPSWTTVLPRLTTDGVTLFTILDDDWFSTGSPVQQYERMVSDLGQAATDAQVEGPTEPGVGITCDAIVARVRTIAGL